MSSDPSIRRATSPGSASGLEVERKFLIPEPPSGLERYPAARIDQGYLAVSGDGTEVRIRRSNTRTTLTVKSGRGRVRTEEELDIDPERFERLWPLTESRRLEKTRYELPADSDLTVELDIYAGPLAGLATAEVEFPSEAEADAFSAPEWFGPEITDDGRYSNHQLAVEGLPVRAGDPSRTAPTGPVPAEARGG